MVDIRYIVTMVYKPTQNWEGYENYLKMHQMRVSMNGVPKKNPIRMDEFGGTPISGNLQISSNMGV